MGWGAVRQGHINECVLSIAQKLHDVIELEENLRAINLEHDNGTAATSPVFSQQS